MSNPNKIIFGAVISAAAIATAIDHTRHRLPEPVTAEQSSIVVEDEEEASPCSLDSGDDGSNEIVVEESESVSPCGLGD